MKQILCKDFLNNKKLLKFNLFKYFKKKINLNKNLFRKNKF